MPIEEDFRDAADRATKLPKRPPNDVLLQLYSLYKQGTEGDVSGCKAGAGHRWAVSWAVSSRGLPHL